MNPEGPFQPFARDERSSRGLGEARHPGPRAPHRRAREGRRSPATSATTRSTTSACATCAPRRCRGSGDIPPPTRFSARRGRPARVGWGSTRGAIHSASDAARDGHSVANMHLRHLWPLPANGLGRNLRPASSAVLVPELNSGQLVAHPAQRVPVARRSVLSQGAGSPFTTSPRIVERIQSRS